MSATRLVISARGTISTTAPMRSSQGARLKSSHQSRIRTAPPTTVPIPMSIGSSDSTGASATPAIWRTMITSAGQRRNGLRAGVSFDCVMGCSFLRRVHHTADRVDQQRPAILLAQQLRLSAGLQAVILRSLVGFADAPLRFQPAAFFEAVQSGVERTGFDLQQRSEERRVGK